MKMNRAPSRLQRLKYFVMTLASIDHVHGTIICIPIDVSSLNGSFHRPLGGRSKQKVFERPVQLFHQTEASEKYTL